MKEIIGRSLGLWLWPCSLRNPYGSRSHCAMT
jgi:hypothetical protein